MDRLTNVVKNLIIINVLMFVVFKFVFPQWAEWLALYYPTSSMFRPFQIITHMFMHGGVGHIFFNLFALYMFGTVLERLWGSKKFLFYYLACGLGAAAFYLFAKYISIHYIVGELDPAKMQLIQDDGYALLQSGRNYSDQIMAKLNKIINIPAVGASGAIYGLLLAFGMKFPNEKLMLIFFPVPIAAKYFIPVLMVGELYLGLNNFSWDNVAHFAHLGGALTGFLIMTYWTKNPTNRIN